MDEEVHYSPPYPGIVHVKFLLEFCVKSLLETFSTLHHYLNFMRNPKVDGLFTIYETKVITNKIHDLLDT